MSELTFLVTLKEVVNQLEREINKLNQPLYPNDRALLKQLILARTIEDMRLVSLMPERLGHLETLADMVRSNYRRDVGEDSITLEEDVITNNSLSRVRSADLSFQSILKLYRYIVVIEPREYSH